MPPRDEIHQRGEALLSDFADRWPHGEYREGQHQMTAAIIDAILDEDHLVVQAGTGTGKSLAYLAAITAIGSRAVIATATKALQDQLASKDIPALNALLESPIRFALLKGRSNYLCRQRLAELNEGSEDALFSEGTVSTSWLTRLNLLAESDPIADRASLDLEPPPEVWAAVSVGAEECPGIKKCPSGEHCGAEKARRLAAEADVVIVNTHLYGMHLKADLSVLPPHRVVVFDEAHEVEDTLAATIGTALAPSAITHLARSANTLIADPELIEGFRTDAESLRAALTELGHVRIGGPYPNRLAGALVRTRERINTLTEAINEIPSDAPDVLARAARLSTNAMALARDLDTLLAHDSSEVCWVTDHPSNPAIHLAPLDVGEVLLERMWHRPEEPESSNESLIPRTAVFTSATIPQGLPQRLSLPADTASLDVGSPFPFATNAMLYCAAHLPEARTAAFEPAMHEELIQLIEAAGGRTLGLFTSYRAMNNAYEALAERIEFPLLVQGERPKGALVEAFQSDASSCLFATMGFWAGIDVPGQSLSLVTIDKIPFPRPDDPLLQARREHAGRAGFAAVDLPRAATMLAQGAGRLIRRRTDRGVVAVFDQRLANSLTYRWELINALPPMRRTKDLAEAKAFLSSLSDQ